jgi:rhodanese-related sulfurtransferase
MKKLLALVAIGLVAFSVRAAEFPDISITDVKAAIKSHKAVIIDVNGTESFDKGHVPTALNFETIEGKLQKALPKDKNTLIIAYCGNPRCNAYQGAAKAASKLGYKNVKHMSAGIMGWKDAGEKTEKSGKTS